MRSEIIDLVIVIIDTFKHDWDINLFSYIFALSSVDG